LGGIAPHQAEAKIVNRSNPENNPQSRIETKPGISSKTMPPSNTVPDKPTVTIKVNSIIAKAKAIKI
jgi:hypothetical protein